MRLQKGEVMTYEFFLEGIKRQVADSLGDEYEVKLIQVRKNNGILLDGLLIGKQGDSMMPTIYLNRFYEEMCTQEDLEGIARRILEAYRNRTEIEPGLEAKVKDYDFVRKQISYRVIHYARNEELLQDVLHVRFLDMAVVFYVLLPEFGDEFVRASFLVHDNQMTLWGKEKDEIIKDAFLNAPQILPEKIFSLEELLYDILGEDSEGLPKQSAGMYVLTNEKKYYGASALLYPNVLQNFAEELGCDLFLLPCSIHEVLLLPYDEGMDIGRLREMVEQVNETELTTEEILSDQVYHYSRSKKELMIAEG